MSILAQLYAVLVDHVDQQTMPYRVLKASRMADKGEVYEDSLTDHEYDDLIDLFRGLGEMAVTQWLFLLRHDEGKLRKGLTSAATSDPPSTTPCIIQTAAARHSNDTNDDELSYGDDGETDRKPPEEYVDGNASNPVYPTEQLLALIQPDLKLTNGTTLTDTDIKFGTAHLIPFVHNRSPLSEIAQQIFDEHYARHPARTIQLCQLLRAALERVDSSNVATVFGSEYPLEDTLKIVENCITELEDIYDAHRSARFAGITAQQASSSVPVFVSWKTLSEKVNDRLHGIVSTLKQQEPSFVDDDTLREAARLALYVLEGGGPRRTEYKSLVSQDCTKELNTDATNVYANGSITLRNYYMVKAYSERHFPVSENTQIVLDELVRRNAEIYLLSGSTELVTDEKWEEMCGQDFKRIAGKRLRFRHLRFAYIYHLRKSRKLDSVHSKALLAKAIGTTLPDVFANIKLERPKTSEETPKRPSSSKHGSTPASSKRRKTRRTRTDSQEQDADTMSMESGEIDDDDTRTAPVVNQQ